MEHRTTDVRRLPTSTIGASFAHGDEFDYVELRLSFDGIVFSAFPLTDNRYDGPWEDLPCDQVDFLVYFSSVFCAFPDYLKFLEAIAVGVEKCAFYWEAEGPDGCFSWHRRNADGIGILTVTWQSRPAFRYGILINGREAVSVLYRAFRNFVESDAYDPLRYEKLTLGESLELILEPGGFTTLLERLVVLEAEKASWLVQEILEAVEDRQRASSKERFPLETFLETVAGTLPDREPLPEGCIRHGEMPEGWDGWTIQERQEELVAIMDWGGSSWYGKPLRTMRSPLVEFWIDEASEKA